MRTSRRADRALLLLLWIFLGATLAVAQTSARATQPAPTAQGNTIQRWVDSLAHDANGLVLAPADVHTGPQTVAAGTRVNGSIAAWHGDLNVYGTVAGNAVAIGGNVIIHSGATVRGTALAVGGEVRNEGGTVGGDMRSLSALTVGPLLVGPHRTTAQATRRSISLAVGWYLVLAAIGLFVLLFARRNLETIAERIQDDFSRSFLYGLLGQLALFPAFVVMVVALAITILGIVLIPFAVIAFVLAAAGACALGFLAMSFVTGDAAMRWRGAASPYAPPPMLQFLLIGLSLYFILWVVSGAFAWAGVIGGILRFIAAVVTWTAATVGFGATLASRGGTRTMAPPPIAPPPAEDYAWQTPTPVSGVAAARRPTPPPRSRQP